MELKAALHSILHVPAGASDDYVPDKPSPPMRIFLLGARAESTLPPHLWQQLTYIFPRTPFHIYFIGPEVGVPLLDLKMRRSAVFSDEGGWGVPSYGLEVSQQLTLTSLKAPYEDIHHQLGPFDPYTDVFVIFSPGLGFPHQGPTSEDSSKQPLVQAQTTWRQPLQQILETKCPLFFTAFSPLDLQRDVATLFGTSPPSRDVREFPEYVILPTQPIDAIEGVTDEFELILAPGRNPFSSEKWEIAEWDVRVGVKTNWGVWGIRGKRYEVVDKQDT